MNRENYLNKEKVLYDYIVDNLNEDNLLVVNDWQLAEELDASITTIFRWRQKLIDKKVIKCKVKHINGKKYCVISLKEKK